MAYNFPTAYVRVASQTYVLQHIYLFDVCSDQLCTVGLDYTANMCDNRDTGAPLMMEENNRYELLS